LSPVIEPANVA